MIRAIRLWLQRRPRWGRDDEGIALVTVLGVLFVITALLLTALAVAMVNLAPTREDQDAKAAIAAAQAGVDDYLARLKSNSNYGTQTTDSTNAAMCSDTVAPLCSSTSGRVIPGGTTGAAFKYVVQTSSVASGNGTVTLKVTGTVNGVSRNLQTTFRPKSFLDFIYLTDHENQSPTFSGNTAAICTQRWWETGSNSGRGGSSCGEIGFAPSDVISGPMHTNDTPMLNGQGTTFTSTATTSTMRNGVACTTTSCYRNPNNNSTGTAYWPSQYAYNATTFPNKKLSYEDLMGLPTANTELRTKALATGCLFTGATHIAFDGTSMRVYSPNTQTNTCGFNASSRASMQTIPVPDGNVIYVDGKTGTCTSGQTNSGILASLTGRPAAQSSYPLTGEYTGGRFNPDYSCADGTAYVQGTLDGKITIGSAQDIIVTGDIRYQTTSAGGADSDDILGMIPTGTIWVYHPVTNVATPVNMIGTAYRVDRIDAAMLTLQDSFFVQNYNYGTGLGTLTVVGSISQKYRGTVGTGSATTGYIKDYQYDERFARGYIQPPEFLAPTQAQWIVSQVVES